MTDWSGADYERVSALQRSVASETLAELVLDGSEWVLDIGCGDGFLTREIAAAAPTGFVVGIDASPRMVATAHRVHPTGSSWPRFVRADARRLPFGRCFDLAVSFNALHWVPQLDEALAGIAAVLRPGGRSVLQMVCAGERPSIESTAMAVAEHPRWSGYFTGFSAPFRHLDPAVFADLANGCGLRVTALTVRDREWDFGSREAFTAWCAVGTTAWTDLLPEGQRAEFVEDLVSAYEPVTGRPGLIRFMQMRAELHT
ncbi:methyltransferase domain-containing protein [Mycobacterium sp. NBC_00419]|uniref:methyltransferase domain-containing protein n=1 Tax=Mycobacterium sp. NBC_00419 TaxID=2975989 RepID=UPI002E1BCE48